MQAVATAVLESPPTRHPVIPREPRRAPQPAGSAGTSSRLQDRLRSGEFAVVCEMQPSHGSDADRALRDATRLREIGADAILVTPSTSPRAQISPATLAFLFAQRLEIETILAAAAWDKSAMALQADLLGAHAFGIRNVLCRTGAPPPLGDYPQVRMWGVDSVGLIEILRSLNEGRDANSIPTGKPTSFFVGARVNPTSENPEQELADARRKIEAGAGFLITRPVYDLPAYLAFLDALGPLQIPILLGVTPLRDFNHAEYLRYEVPGVLVPDATLARMREAGEHAAEAGLELARELIRDARGRAAGIVLASAAGSPVEIMQLLETLPR
jgi:5,10-methylenetetrahydrofolate reductase